jgi:hypothetical protein
MQLVIPKVNKKKQHRPSVEKQTVNGLITNSHGMKQMFFILISASGLRVGETLRRPYRKHSRQRKPHRYQVESVGDSDEIDHCFRGHVDHPFRGHADQDRSEATLAFVILEK